MPNSQKDFYKKLLGRNGEKLAANYLKKLGYKMERNLKREFKEELGINIENPKFTIKLKYLKYPSETEDKGRVIIDLRKYNKGQISLEKMASLRNQGKDYGNVEYQMVT